MAKKLPQGLLDLISEAVGEKVENCSLKVNQGNTVGDGHLGELFFVTVKVPNVKQPYELAIKQTLDFGEEDNDLFIKCAYKNEIYVYEKILPTFKKFQEEAGVKVFDCTAKCYATSHEPKNEKLAMENLKLKDFQLFDKKKNFDKEHMDFVFQKYAQLHGTSLAYKHIHPEKFETLLSPLTNMYQFVYMATKEDIEKFPRVSTLADSDISVEDVDKLQQYLFDGMGAAAGVIPTSDENSIFIHGDCWSNNFMFKYDNEGNLSDVRILDFQLSNIGNLTNDLSYCFFSAASKEQLDDVDHYLKLYHDTLTSRLAEFGLKSEEIYSYNTLKNDWKKLSGFGVMMSLVVLQLKLSQKYKSDDPKEFIANNANVIYDKLTYKKKLNDIFRHLIDNNHLK